MVESEISNSEKYKNQETQKGRGLEQFKVQFTGCGETQAILQRYCGEQFPHKIRLELNCQTRNCSMDKNFSKDLRNFSNVEIQCFQYEMLENHSQILPIILQSAKTVDISVILCNMNQNLSFCLDLIEPKDEEPIVVKAFQAAAEYFNMKPQKILFPNLTKIHVAQSGHEELVELKKKFGNEVTILVVKSYLDTFRGRELNFVNNLLFFKQGDKDRLIQVETETCFHLLPELQDNLSEIASNGEICELKGIDPATIFPKMKISKNLPLMKTKTVTYDFKAQKIISIK